MTRHLLHIPRRLVKGAVYVLLAGVLVFIALTRTEVGRDALRSQLELRFNDLFAGRLEIGALKGNLLNTLYGSDLRIRDDSGRLVLSIDSVVVRPSWRDIMRRSISTSSITLFDPHVRLVYGDDGSWNLVDVFNRSVIDTLGGASWSFTSAEVIIHGGRVTTSHEAAVPSLARDSVLYNYAASELRDISARAVVEWQPELKLIDVLSFSGRSPDLDIDVESLRGQFLLEREGIALNEVELRAGNTHLVLSGSAGPMPVSPETLLELNLDRSRLDHAELRRIFPRFPLRDAVTTSLRARGPLDRLVIEQLDVERGSSRLAAEGTVIGLPDSLDFELATTESSFTSADVLAVLPEELMPAFSHLGTVRVSLYAAGVLPLSGRDGLMPRRLTSRLDVQTPVGRLAGTFDIGRNGGTPTFAAKLHASDVDPGRILRNAELPGRLSGTIELGAVGHDPDSGRADMTVNLSRSHLAGRFVDSLQVSIRRTDRHYDASGFARMGAGWLTASGRADLDGAVYQLESEAGGLDLGAVLGEDSLSTGLNARVVMAGSGRTWNAVEGSLQLFVDSSTVRAGQLERKVPPHYTTASLRQIGSGEPLFEIAGDVVEARIQGDVAVAPLLALGRLWNSALSASILRIVDKPYGEAALLSATADDGDQSLADLILQEAARAELDRAGLVSQELRIRASIQRPDILSALFPTLPPLPAMRGTFDLFAGADALTLDGVVDGDWLSTGAFAAGPLRATISLAGRLDAPLDVSLQVDSDHLILSGQRLNAARLETTLSGDAGQLRFSGTLEGRQEGPLRLAARVDMLPDRNRITFTDIVIGTGDYVWSSPTDGTVDFYSNAVAIRSLMLENRDVLRETPQRIRIEGAVSDSPLDTMFVAIEQVRLSELSEFVSMKHRIGGRLDGRIALTGVAQQPMVTGSLHVGTLSFDNRLLGELDVVSSFLPGSPDLALDLALRPAPPDSIAASGLVIEENRLRAAGTLRLPSLDGDRNRTDDGSLDLRFAVDRADAFFFEYLFPTVVDRVDGHFEGMGSVRGSFRRPLFEGDLRLVGGRFDVPRFNLSLQAEGPVMLDKDGVKLDGLSISDVTGGTGTVSGGILFNDYRYFSFDLHAALDRIQIINVLNARDLAFYGQIWASGSASLTGPVSRALLRSTDAVTSTDSNIFIPINEGGSASDAGFIVFADSTGRLPDLSRLVRRTNLLARRPAGEREFVDGLEMDLNIFAPQGSTVHLVIDPLVGDVINAVGTGRIQLQRSEGEFFTYGELGVTSGDYLFTAGEVFFRRFLIDQGRITWDGDPLNATLDIDASYRTRASSAGLNLGAESQSLIPLIVHLHVTGRVTTPVVDLSLAVERNTRNVIGNYEGLEAELNQPERAAQYATSVLLTNSFLLTTDLTDAETSGAGSLANTRNQLAFNSLSQLVASQLNRYLNHALPNVDLNIGLQGESTQDLDVTYGVALRLLDERLIIRGQGIYQNDQTRRSQQGLLDEFVVEMRLRPNVSVEVFYRREGEILTSEPLTSTTGAGLSYETQFVSWPRFIQRLLGRSEHLREEDDEVEAEARVVQAEDS